MAVALKNLSPVDLSTLIYNVIVALILVLFHNRIPFWYFEILINLLMIFLVIFIFSRVRETSPGMANFFKSFYPLLFLLAAYQQTGRINRIVFPELLDPVFQRIEYELLGFQPAIVFARTFPQPWLIECMHFAYFTYYFQFPILGLMLYFKRGQQPFADYMFSLCNTFYVCYLIYIVLPVAGALTFNMNDFPAGGLFTSIMAVLYEQFELGGAAFPSSHVAVAAVVLYYGIKYFRRAAPLFMLLFISLAVSTVYCRYHYAIDVLAGIVTAITLIGISKTLLRNSR
jgi:membrane-associated phospholipid phosphatase